MDPDQEINPQDLLGPRKTSSTLSCFLDCCKPKKEVEEEDDIPGTKQGQHKEVPGDGKLGESKETNSKAVVRSNNALSPKAVVAFLKMMLSYLLFQSLGKRTKPKNENSAKWNEETKVDLEEVPVLDR